MEFVSKAQGVYFACYRIPHTEPGPVYQACIMVFPNTDKTRDFARKLSRFILAKLDLPSMLSWVLDQAALFSVLAMLSETNPDFIFADIVDGKVEKLLNDLAPDNEKNTIMNA